ncbi:MAG: P27 family phage terminase small subunit [Phycisphaerales bacterium]|nr:P27 family phage terminase small subunit [Phycisphaerales bacterium]
MGLRGPQPTPTDLLRLSGSREVNGRNDAPSLPGVPEKPEWLTGRGAEVWANYVGMAGQLPRLLAATDGNALAAACCATAMVERVARELNEQGLMVPDEKAGREVANPLARTLREWLETSCRLWAKFGATPADRVRTGSAGAVGAPKLGLAKFTRG